jgi:hypothetical protein
MALKTEMAVTAALLMAAAPALAQPAQTPAGRIDAAALPAAGPVRECLQLRDIQQTKPVGSRIIMFRTGGNRWYRNDLDSSCAFTEQRVLRIRSTGGTLCAIDTVDIADQITSIGYGFCQLGKFTPVAVPKGARF